MVKPLLLVALVANLFLLVLSTENQLATSSVGSSNKGPSKPAPCGSKQTPPCGPSKPTVCGANQFWANCPIAVCAPKTCDDVGYPIACPDLLPDGKCPVPPGCICKEGLVKNAAGNCVPMSHCPSCGGDSNAVSGCGTNCNRLCSNYNRKPVACTQECLYNSCDCRPGFVFDEITEKCVIPKNCSRLICKKKNEIYDPCPAPCPFHTCGIDDAAISCIPPLRPGDPKCPPAKCRCRDGYYRNDVGECVLWEQCPVCKGLNEMYDPCPAPCPPQRCDVNIALILCMVPPKLGDPECEPGCRCIDNYVRNYTGVCIPKDQCPSCPNQNEKYDQCIAPCPPRRCDVDDRLIRCAAPPKLGDKECVAGCRCDDGFYKNSFNVCVPRNECPSCKGPHEFYACGGACDNVCATLHEQSQTNCPIMNIRCNDMCYCDEGYARDGNNTCIPIENCEPTCKGEHEVYSDCIQGDCKPKTCTELGYPVACPRIDPKYCEKGCLCKDGYVRDKNGVCIPKDQCPSCGGDCNAKSGCGVYCNNLCSDIGQQPDFCLEICYENACDCKEGYFLNTNTLKCTLPEQCTETCGEDEIFNDCIQENCNPQSCSQLGFPINCTTIDRKYCEAGCICKAGLVRNSEGVCIPASQCPSCGGDPNAMSGCGKNCGRLCSNYMQEGVICTLECRINGCDCRKGYVFDTNRGICVLPKQCTPVCKQNEMYSECINGGCQAKNCSQIGLPIPCVKIDPKYCIKGCLCKDGYLRDENLLCVPKEDCKPKCNKPNEYYEPCDYNCPPNTCDSLGKAYACPIREGDICTGKCKCKQGYYRDRRQQCITEAQCQMCKDPHEYFSCGGACDNVCATLQKQNQTVCPIINIKCNDKCYCDKDYARAKNGTCIPIKNCNEPQCGKNERYEKCPAWSCSEPKTCDEVGYPGPCQDAAASSKCPVKPACVCIDGYVRNKTGVCIPIKECPSCGGDPNAESGCGTNCGKKCEDLGKKSSACILICKINGCDCKKGYYYDKKKGKCVLASECTGICTGKNEVFEDCTFPTCEARKCSELGFPLNCTYVPQCKKGCVCKNGHVRNAIGVCIPVGECPSCGGDQNAKSGCGVNCLKKCYDLENPDKPRPCPKICRVNACDCKPGYYIDENTNKCVCAEDCTPTCNTNEVYSECTNGGCQAKNCSQIGLPIPCVKIDPKYCIKGCVCKKDYLRDENGVCIPKNDCKPKCNKPNEYYEPYDCNCPPNTCESLDVAYDCPKPDADSCTGRCKCKKGYYRNQKGECITKEQCRKCMGPYEYFSCSGACDNVCSTLNKQNQTNCPIVNKKCNEMCYCEEDYARAKNGTCIPIKDCKKPQCGENERYEKCPAWLCEPKTCNDVGYPVLCPDVIAGANCSVKPACVCVEGYVRDEYDNCIPIKECPSCGGDENAQSGCGVNCLKKCYDLQNPDNPRPCLEICKINGCDCNDGFYLDEFTNKCVCANECTPSCGENEVFDPCTNGGCNMKNCSQLGGPMPKKDPKKCIPGCSCREGYLRNNKGICVPVEQCPKAKCGKNQKFIMCPSGFCGPRKCDQLGYPVNCPTTDDGCCSGPPGCICIDNYVMSDEGKCIPIRDCPSCGGDPNAWAGCGINCGKKCNDKNKICPRICKPNSCDCRDGYLFDKYVDKCVKPDCCTPPCGENEVYNQCVNGGCGYRNCSEINGPILCIDPIECKGGCSCKKDYLRLDKTGVCVPKSECPETCNRPNEVYVKCPQNCPPQTCESIGIAYPCAMLNIDEADCVGECRCKDGYYKNLNNECISEKNCLKCKRAHEYYSCGPECDNECKNIDTQSKDNCPIKNIQCVSKCYCEDGYARDNSSNCIPIKDCPKTCDKPNEVYVKCPQNCPPQTCESIGKIYHCPKIKTVEADCVGECRCKDGFYKNLKNECISEKNCLKCKRAHEYYSCGPECDNECKNIDTQSKDNCPIKNIQCVSKCYCEDGYARDNSSNCIPIKDCPGCTTEPPVNSTVAIANFQKGNIQMCIDLLKEILKSKPNENVMFSAFSILVVFAQLTLRAIKEALVQLLGKMNLDNKEQVRVVFPFLLESLKDPENVIFDILNKIYADDKNCPLTIEFKDDSKLFSAPAENVNFFNGVQTADKINKWVNESTRGKIDKLVTPDMFSSLTRLALFNVLYFKGDWLHQFDEKNTKPAKFYLNDKDSRLLQTMNLINTFKYVESDKLDAQIILLPYKGGQFNFLILLPRTKTGLKPLMEKLDPDTLQSTIDSLEFKKCNVSLPRMDYQNDYSNLKELLIAIGLTAPFKTDSGDFVGITTDNQPVTITDMVQKSVFLVNEKGTVGAVATGAILSTRSLPQPSTVYTFNANRQFLFFLCHLNTIFMSGAFVN